MALELKPCPFCGGKPISYEIEPHKHFITDMPDHPGSFVIECAACDFYMTRYTEVDAAGTWNTRAALSTAESGK